VFHTGSELEHWVCLKLYSGSKDVASYVPDFQPSRLRSRPLVICH